MKKKRSFRHKFTEALELPAEVMEGTPRVTLLGTNDLLVENQQGIYEYYDKGLRLSTSCGILSIEGKDLELRELSQERVYVAGEIRGLWFENQ